MSEQDRQLERVRLAGRRLISADQERAAALHEATLALQAVGGLTVERLAGESGLSGPAIHALLARQPRPNQAEHGRRLLA